MNLSSCGEQQCACDLAVVWFWTNCTLLVLHFGEDKFTCVWRISLTLRLPFLRHVRMLSSRRQFFIDCFLLSLAMKNGIRIRSGADGRLAMRKSPKRKKKNKIQKQKRKENTNKMVSKRLKFLLECKGFMALRRNTSYRKQSKVTYFSPWSWVFLTGTLWAYLWHASGLGLHILF